VTSSAYQSQAVALAAQPTGPEFVYSGPIAKRLTAEEFMDALWQITSTGPKHAHKTVDTFFTAGQKAEHKSYRASLVASDLLQRSLGRPNREQVVSDRPAVLTTLQALDLSNSELLASTLAKGGPKILKRSAGQDGSTLTTWLYESALSRDPTDDERKMAGELLGSPPTKEGVEDLVWEVMMLPEFQIIR
jgi:hypothetical protein